MFFFFVVVFAVAIENDNDKYTSMFHVLYAAASCGGSDTFICL